VGVSPRLSSVLVALLLATACGTRGSEAAREVTPAPSAAGSLQASTSSGPAARAPSRWTDLVAGDDATCAWDAAGAAVCWGFGPERVEPRGLALAKGTPAALSRDGLCAIQPGGGVKCWSPRTGAASAVELARATVLAGSAHGVCALGSGAVECRIGDSKKTLAVRDATALSVGVPLCVVTPAGASCATFPALDLQPVPQTAGALEIAVGGDFACARLATGVRCWPTTRPAAWWKAGPIAGLVAVRALSAGASHACALDEEGGVWCWGDASREQLGVPSSRCEEGPCMGKLGCERRCAKPVRVPGLPRIERVVTGAQHTCALDAGGLVWCWGGESPRVRGGSAEPAPTRVLP
jgi:hypothetical protein